MSNIVKPGGLNALGPLYRDGQTVPACTPHNGQDPNAPRVYYWGMGLAWEGGALTSIYGDAFPPAIRGEDNNFIDILDDNVNVWSPLVNEEILKISSSIMAGVAQGYRVNGVPAIIAPAALLLSGADVIEGGSEIGHALMMPYTVADTIHGTATLSDGTTLTFTAEKLQEEQIDESFMPTRIVTFDGELDDRTVVSMTIDESAGIDAMRVFIGNVIEDEYDEGGGE